MLDTPHPYRATAGRPLAEPYVRPDAAFHRARDLLRQKSQLTLDQFNELHTIFTDLPPAQVTSLMTDDRHLQQIRKYEIMAWRHPRAAAPIVALLLLAIAFAATVALWGP